MTRSLPPGSTPDPRWWHRRWLPVGGHRPEVPLPPIAGWPQFHQCRCRWIGFDLGVYAAYAVALGASPGKLAGEWVWLPERVWLRALEDVGRRA